jgi:hypothetical protein
MALPPDASLVPQGITSNVYFHNSCIVTYLKDEMRNKIIKHEGVITSGDDSKWGCSSVGRAFAKPEMSKR